MEFWRIYEGGYKVEKISLYDEKFMCKTPLNNPFLFPTL